MIYTMSYLKAMSEALEVGETVEVDQETWYYYLEVLPPTQMG